jgi:chlorite dismutase
MPPLPVTFVGGDRGRWAIEQVTTLAGPELPTASSVDVVEGGAEGAESSAAWILRGVAGHERYLTRTEHDALAGVQEPLGRPAATRAALIPIRKSEAWWSLAQDERRSIFEERSHHVTIGLDHLPAVARRLHHSRDLGEPFDFLTWFEFSPQAAAGFDDLLRRLRATEEWKYVDREIEIRLAR